MLKARDTDENTRRMGSANIETFFLAQWQELDDELLDFAGHVRSVDLYAVESGLRTLIQLHFGSKGLK